MAGTLVLYAVQQIIPKYSPLKQALTVSHSLGWESRRGLPGSLWLKLSPAVRLGCLSSKVSLGKDPLSGPPGGLAGFRSSQARGFSSSLAMAQKPPQISATGVSPQSSSQHGSRFPQSEGVRGGTQLIFYSLEASHLSQPHQWEGVKCGVSASRQSHWWPTERMPSQR